MKRITGLCFIFILSTLTQVQAGFRLPVGVYRIAELEEAQERAKTWKKPISFIYSDDDGSCPLTDAASLDAIKNLKYRTVVVYADVGSDWDALPGPVQTALRSSESGRFIPKTVIIDPDFRRVIAIIPYSRDNRERSKLFREALRRIGR